MQKIFVDERNFPHLRYDDRVDFNEVNCFSTPSFYRTAISFIIAILNHVCTYFNDKRLDIIS